MPARPAIVVVEKHKVRTGETLKSIAESAGLSWQTLAKFNWNTADPVEINRWLRDQVGCTRKTAGGNYIFTDFDHPGIVLVPRPWSASGLWTMQSHQIRVDPLMLVVDYEFREEKDDTALLFTIRGRQPGKLFVRLYECSNSVDAPAREDSIRSHAPDYRDGKGFKKSNRYYEVGDEDSLESIAADHGFSNADEIRGHFENAGLRAVRGESFSVGTGDYVFVPQLEDSRGPIPLGPLLEVKPANESVPDGKRYMALWRRKVAGYDPLDWNAWTPVVPNGIPALRYMSFPQGRAGTTRLYAPQFAVLLPDFRVIGVSPAPLWLVHQAKFEKPGESDDFHVFLADGRWRKFDSSATSDEFEGIEEPLTFFGALNPDRQA